MSVNKIQLWLCAVLLLGISTNARVAFKDEDVLSNTIDSESTTKDTVIYIDLATIRPKSNNDTDKGNPTIAECSEDIHNTIDSKPCDPEPKVDNGTALLLTPFIEEGRVEEARNASRVPADLFLNVESYSGFLTVNKTHNSNMFFWYFPVQGRPVSTEPWLIWLQGGPGASSLVGLFDEIGPFTVNAFGELVENPHTWLKRQSLVFIDNPIGSGFSFTDHDDGFIRNMDSYGDNLYEVVRQLVQLYPELQSPPLFVAGESYAGKYVPSLAVRIHRQPLPVNLKGVIVGNGYVEPRMVDNMTDSYYSSGMVGPEERELLRPLAAAYTRARKEGDGYKAQRAFNELTTGLLYLSSQYHGFNFMRDSPLYGPYIAKFLQRSDIKRALHVGDISYASVNYTVYSKLGGDFLSSAKPLYEELLEHYRVLIYCGQLDLVLSCPRISEELRTWNWSQNSEFIQNHRAPILIDNKLALFLKSGGHLSEAVIRGAGHIAPSDKPRTLDLLVSAWTHGDPASPSNPTGAEFNPNPMSFRVHRLFVQLLVSGAINATRGLF